MNKKTICFVAGKSGGHIIPCLTMTAAYPATGVLFFSTNTPLDKKIISAHKNITWHIMLPLSSFIPSKLFSYPHVTWHFICSLFISFFYLYKHKPTTVITTGGIVAIPVCIAAYILRIPITLYALDAVAGKALKILKPLATNINICFEDTRQCFSKKNCTLTPYPIKFSAIDKAIDQKKARIQLNLDPEKKTILFLGGSQGSLFLNQCAQKLVNNSYFLPATMQIIHQTGNIDQTDWNSIYKNNNIMAHVFSYSHDLALIYNASDYIICRAGAGTLFEVLFFEKKCIVIPLKTQTTEHQVDNARAISTMYPNIFEYMLQEDVEKNYNFLFSKFHNLKKHNSSLQSPILHN